MPIETIDGYIETFHAEVRTILEAIRQTIREAVPGTAETISYRMPTFELDGRRIIHFAAYKNHIGFYPAPSGSEDFEREIAPYRAGKSSIRFPIKDPIPHDLIRKIVDLQVNGANES